MVSPRDRDTEGERQRNRAREGERDRDRESSKESLISTCCREYVYARAILDWKLPPLAAKWWYRNAFESLCCTPIPVASRNARVDCE